MLSYFFLALVYMNCCYGSVAREPRVSSVISDGQHGFSCNHFDSLGFKDHSMDLNLLEKGIVLVAKDISHKGHVSWQQHGNRWK